MKNALYYYYNLEPDEIHQFNKIIKFKYKNKKYILYETNKNYKEINDIYRLHNYLLSLGIYCHRIVLNTSNEIITQINNRQYILLEINIKNRIIDLNDILYISNIPINSEELIYIKRKEWSDLWKNKIDYIEYQISQLGKKYETIRKNSDYYIGLTENCISLLNSFTYNKIQLAICHNRINKKTTTDDYYNPIEFIIDKKVRDIGEYLKSFINTDEIIRMIEILNNNRLLTNTEIKLLFIRYLYPSKYFDNYEKITNNTNNYEIDRNIESQQKIKNYEMNIKKIYNYIRSISDLPKIEWLIKD